MGLYDYINGEQVKIFYHPIFDEYTKDTWHSGGSLVDYVNGDNVNLKTLYYKRPENFIVLDENEYEQNPLLHVIKKGKVNTTTSLKDADESLFEGNEEVITYYGRNLGLKTKEDCYNYIKDKKLSAEKYTEITKEHSLLYNTRYIPTHWIMSHIKPSETINKFRPDRKSKLEVIFRGINHIEEIQNLLKENFDSYDELSALLETNDELWDKFCDMVYPMASKIHESSKKIMDEIDAKNKPLIEQIEKAFQEKYPVRALYEEEKQFGEFLECLRYMYTEKSDTSRIQGLASNKERYEALILAIKDFVEKNDSIVESYAKWLELDEVQTKNIKEIISDIISNKEKLNIKHLDNILCILNS